MKIIDKMFGTYSEREIKRVKPIVTNILNLEEQYSKMTDTELKNKTKEFKERLKKGESLDDIMPEAFATVKEASWRVLGLKPYEVQIIGAVILHQGRIAEMKTGEGKTLVATLPAYLNALKGEGVFIVTVNEYLAKRDSEQMGKIYTFLGLSVGVIEHDMTVNQRRKQYNSDIIYATNNEIGFDYLKDNMVHDINLKVQRPFQFAIIDEVDSILIDEARTPLIISGEGDDVSEGYIKADKFVRSIKGVLLDNDETSKREKMFEVNGEEDKYKDFDYIIYEKDKTVTLTEKGVSKAERFYKISNLGDLENLEINHYVSRALRAHALFKKDIDYVVEGDEIVIVDEHTGRLMEGRRYSEGIHQAIETKEGVLIRKASRTLATISFQNLFKKFRKLSGMTGTAMTEKDEFIHTYDLDVVEIPTNKPVIRKDLVDKVYTSKPGKLKGIIKTVKECNEKGQPILVGTASVETSEELSKLFKKEGIKHNVLNAKQNANEAKVVAQAGEFGTVTIATNMAGRGTDIMLGGNVDFKVKEELRKLGYPQEQIEESNTHSLTEDKDILEIRNKYKELHETISEKTKPWAEKVKDVGGLYILGTERHSSRRIDNQLRGRAGRQGDPGVSEFLISMEDDLLRLFGGEQLTTMFAPEDGQVDDVPLDIKMLANMVSRAQRRIEGMHFSARKTILDYDDVMNIQRELVYEQRDKFISKASLVEDVISLSKLFIEDTVNKNVKGKRITLEEQEKIAIAFAEVKGLENVPNFTEEELYNITPEQIIDSLCKEVEEKVMFFNSHTLGEVSEQHLKAILLFVIDNAWQEHIVVMEDLQEGIGLRAYSQKDPIIIYKAEGYELFEDMLTYVRKEMLIILMENYEKLMKALEDAKTK